MKSRDLVHANHAIHDPKWGFLKGKDGRKIKDPG